MKTLKQIGVDVKKFEFKPASAKSKYPWDAMFNGDLNVLVKGEDYDVDTAHMIPKLKTAARRRYKIVEVSTRDHKGDKLEDMLIIRARDMNEQERADEDAKRAQEKVNRAEARESEETAAEAA